MVSKTDFNYSNKGECQYKIGQELKEFAPMNVEAKFSFNKNSLDIIIGLAPSEEIDYLNDGLNIALFVYHCIPTVIVGGGYFLVSGSIVIKNSDNIDINEWLSSSNDTVNLILVDDYNNYEVKEIRCVQLPMMKTIRKVLKEQVGCVDGEIENTLKIIDIGFQRPWMIRYKDEECKYAKESDSDIQKGAYAIYEPKEKKIHVYY